MMMVDSVMTNVDDVKKLISIILIIILIIQCIFNLLLSIQGSLVYRHKAHNKSALCIINTVNYSTVMTLKLKCGLQRC